MAEKKISELETATLSEMVSAGGFVPVAQAGVATFKVPASDFGGGKVLEAIYGTTTYSSVSSALVAGKSVIVRKANENAYNYGTLMFSASGYIQFILFKTDGSAERLSLSVNDEWTTTAYDNGGDGSLFWVTPGTTTIEDLETAIEDGLIPVCHGSADVQGSVTNATYVYGYKKNGYHYFISWTWEIDSNGKYVPTMLWMSFKRINGVWAAGYDYVQLKLIAGDGIEIDENNEISVKLGYGLDFEMNGGVKVISLDTEAEEVVEAVQKLETDIDTKLTTNMSMADIDEIYDMADLTVLGGNINGGFLLTQAFTVPINNGLRVDDTLIGIYAKQSYNTPVILGLYEFNFDGNNGTGQTLWVGDTGPVSIAQGRNEFPLKNLRSTEQELLASRVYYAAIYLPAQRTANGLLLAGCPGYGATNGNINAIPRFTTLADNIDIDVTDSSATIENYGPWSSGYNERPTVPRFFIQIRNRDDDGTSSTDPFDNLDSYTLGTSTLSSMGFQTAPTANGVLFKKVIPNTSVTVKSWKWTDDQQQGSYGFGWLVTDSSMVALTTQADVTITDVDNGDGSYTHTATPATPLALSNAVYWFPVHGNTSNLLNSVVGVYTGVNTDDLRLCESGYNVQYGTSEDVTSANAFLQLTDSDDTVWTI